MVAATVLLLAAAGAGLALRLEPRADTDTLVGRSTPGYAATQACTSASATTPSTSSSASRSRTSSSREDLEQVLGLEGCLSGNVPAGRRRAAAPAARARGWRATKPAKVVFGPGTFLNEAVGQISDQFAAASGRQARQAEQAARAAYKLARARGSSVAEAQSYAAKAKHLVTAQFYRDVLALAVRYGITSPPSLNDPQFIARLVFDDRRGAGVPKARFASIFPGKEGALIQVRLRDGLSAAQRARAISDIRAAAAMPDWQLSQGRPTP